MKSLLIAILFLPLVVFGQNPGKNFIKTKIYNKPTTTEAITAEDTVVNITYYDGLGRPQQSVAVKAGGTGKDIVKPYVYDASGREVKKYLPYADVSPTPSSPNYRDNAQLLNNINTYYQNKYPTELLSSAPNPYAETVIEASPLARVMQQAAPGNDWSIATASHTIKFEYDTNTKNNVYDFGVSFTGGNTEKPVLTINSYYDVGTLTKTVIRDENWVAADLNNKTTHEFKDVQGRLILKRRYEGGVAQNTYYVYDKFNNLTFVIPPKWAAGVVVSTTDSFGFTTQSVQRNYIEYCYIYCYDYRNRVIEKFTPDKGWEYIVYDKLNRPVLTQDQKQFSQPAGSKKWLFVKYDKFDRTVYTGEHTTDATRAAMQSSVNAATTISETRQATTFANGGATIHYSNNALPNTAINVFSVNYYDQYTNFDTDNIAIQTTTWDNISITTNVKGLVTGSKVRTLGTNLWETSVIMYDAKARPVWIHNINDYLSSQTYIQLLPNFKGDNTHITTVQYKDGQPEIRLDDHFTYDAPGRMLKHTHIINYGTEQLVSYKSYDELGQLIANKVGGTNTAAANYGTTSAWQAIDYSYNIRGWLKSINNVNDNLSLTNADLFAFKVNYNTKDNTQSTQLYNGNISETVWKSKTDNRIRTYSYNYDALNRLKNANYISGYTLNGTTVAEDYTEGSITYDANGNISRLQRKGFTAGTIATIDNLTYTYNTNSNRLKKVTDVYTGTNATTDGFIDGANTATEYTYDGNGNMLTDANKGITNIIYNHLNLPLKVTFAADRYIEYVYDAQGTKLQKKVKEGTAETITQYVAGLIYQQTNATANTLQYFGVEGGYVAKNGTAFNYVYHYKDHLGNVRMSYTKNSSGALTILEENNYYAFGMKHLGYNTVTIPTLGNNIAQKLKYNGKEYEPSLNYNSYEMDFRYYDPAIARWTVIDPIVHHSQSQYCAFDNNPVYFADPDGMDVIDSNDGTEYTGDDAAAFFEAYIQFLDTGSAEFEISGNYYNFIGGLEYTATHNVGGGYTLSEGFGQAVENYVYANSPFYEPLTHAQELATYGQIVGFGNISISAASLSGVAYEYGTIETDKGWLQKYQTIYSLAGMGISVNDTGGVIIARGNSTPTFSDWNGLAVGGSVSYMFFGVSVGGTPNYYAVGASLGIGYGVKGNWNGTYSYAHTSLIGKPYPRPRVDLSNTYINTQTYLGGQ